MMEMFDEVIETKIAPDGKITAKRLVTDEETIAELEFAEACRSFVVAEKRWKTLDATVRLDSSADVCEWWDRLEERYVCEKKVWRLFTARDRSPRSGKMYLQFRETLLSGRSTRADA
jgi:hypothetical protein